MYINECLQSIACQSYPYFEAIICNDNSSDDSTKIIQALADKDPRFILINNTGEGIIAALNTAYGQCLGNYITRMDADDIMPKDKIETLLNALIDCKTIAVVTGKVSYFPIQQIKEGYLKYQNWLNKLVDEETHWENIYKECVIASPCWMMRRDFFEKIGGFKSANYPEDYDLVWRMFLNKTKLIAIPKILHYWRDHSARASRNDANYKNQTYFLLKLHYMRQYLQLTNENCIVWGAGKKGKTLIKALQSYAITPKFWISNNKNKIGHQIYDIKINSPQILDTFKTNYKILIAVSNSIEINEIEAFLKEKTYQASVNYFILA